MGIHVDLDYVDLVLMHLICVDPDEVYVYLVCMDPICVDLVCIDLVYSD